MTIPTSLVACLALLGTTTGCLMTRGDGDPAVDVRAVEPFEAIDVGGVFQLTAEQADELHVELRGDANLLPLVEVESKAGRLRARIHANVLPDLPLQLIVRTPKLAEVDLGGAARGEVLGIDGDSLELEVSGASTLRVVGRTKRLEADVSGASTLDASAVDADAVEIETSGASSAQVVANTSLAAEASGASSLVWRGNATQVNGDASGASSIEHR